MSKKATKLCETDPYDGVIRAAELSECGKYRWWLRRTFTTGHQKVCFLMLNPSMADALIDDPTIRRCMGFARQWGFRQMEVRNLFPYRATKPRELRKAADPTGGARGLIEARAAKGAAKIVAAWGANVPFGRDEKVLKHFEDVPLWCFGTTKYGYPRHPLYVPYSRELVPYNPCAVDYLREWG